MSHPGERGSRINRVEATSDPVGHSGKGQAILELGMLVAGDNGLGGNLLFCGGVGRLAPM